MIIELFGPPGVGKSTFAQALTARLLASGHLVEPILSSRPAERCSSPVSEPARQQPTAVLRRLIRPITDLLAMTRNPLAICHGIARAATLLQLLPPSSTIWSLRLRQYLMRLSCLWDMAAGNGHIVLFDQAFVQVVSSLVLLSRTTNASVIGVALQSIPKSDLLIRLNARRETLEARLRERQRWQSTLEQLFEFDLNTNLELVGVIQILHDLLRERGQPVIDAYSLDRHSLCESVERVEQLISVRLCAAKRFNGDRASVDQDCAEYSLRDAIQRVPHRRWRGTNIVAAKSLEPPQQTFG